MGLLLLVGGMPHRRSVEATLRRFHARELRVLPPSVSDLISDQLDRAANSLYREHLRSPVIGPTPSHTPVQSFLYRVAVREFLQNMSSTWTVSDARRFAAMPVDWSTASVYIKHANRVSKRIQDRRKRRFHRLQVNTAGGKQTRRVLTDVEKALLLEKRAAVSLARLRAHRKRDRQRRAASRRLLRQSVLSL